MATGKRAKNPVLTEKIQREIKPKGPIKYNLELNEEQKEAKRIILGNQITIITGKAGTGKSLVAIQTALDQLFKKEVKKIFITRPVVEVGQSLGFLPGTFEDKIAPYLVPILDNLEKIYDEKKIQALMEEKSIEIYPIAFVRGKTIDDILLIDEAQNCSLDDLKACLTRLGKNGRIIVTGDIAQVDLKKKESSGLNYIIKMAQELDDMGYVDLKENHRSGLVGKMLDYFEVEDAKKEKEEKHLIKKEAKL